VIAEERIGTATSVGSAALKSSEEPALTLRLAISTPDLASMDALRYARRSVLREEWTLGRNPGEPSLEEAIFSPTEVAWTIPRSWRNWCLERLAELELRANRALQQTRRA
jgi:hypothetical protein